MSKPLLVPALLFCSLPCISQTAPPATVPGAGKAASSDFSDEAAVAVRDEVVYRYAADGTGVRTQTTVLRVQSGAALQTFAVLGFPYAGGTQALDIAYARVVGTGPHAAWGQAALGEVYFWGLAASFAVLGWRYNAFLLMKCCLVSFGAGLVALGLVRKR